jgi:hypothetical protein
LPTQIANWGYLINKYPEFAADWHNVTADDTLYIDMPEGETPCHFTYFLDALEAGEFMDFSDDTEARDEADV